MQITSKLAQSIVNEISSLTNKNINFMNEEGLIIASNDKKRIGTFHEGALRVINSEEKVLVKDETSLRGTKPGINLPVYLNDQIIGVIGITGSEEEVKPLGEVIKKMTEILVKENYFEKQSELYRRAKNTFIEEWLSGKIEDKKIFASRGWMHKINVHLPRVAIVLGFNQNFYINKSVQMNVNEELIIQSLRNKVFDTISDFLKFEPQNILYMSSDSNYVILHAINLNYNNVHQNEIIYSKVKQMINYIKETHSIEISVGIGRYHPDIKGIHQSYTEAKRALEIAKKQNKILFYEQLGIESFIEEISTETKQVFIERIFPVDQDPKEIEKMIETLVVFFQSNQSLEETANKLYIHKNTLQYRLKRIKDITGYDPRKFMDAILLYMALSFYVYKEND